MEREFSDTVQLTAERRVTVEKLMRLRVVTPEQVVFDGTARSLVAPAWDGWVGILPGHAPFLTLMGEGPLTVEPASGSRREFEIAGGVMKVESNEVTVLADRILPKSAHIDVGIVARDSIGMEKSGDSSG